MSHCRFNNEVVGSSSVKTHFYHFIIGKGLLALSVRASVAPNVTIVLQQPFEKKKEGPEDDQKEERRVCIGHPTTFRLPPGRR